MSFNGKWFGQTKKINSKLKNADVLALRFMFFIRTSYQIVLKISASNTHVFLNRKFRYKKESSSPFLVKFE